MSVFRFTERTARKQHWCSFCGAPINLGQRHIEAFWIHDGEPSPYRAHLDCQGLANRCDNGVEGVPPFSENYWWEEATENKPELAEAYHALKNRAIEWARSKSQQ